MVIFLHGEDTYRSKKRLKFLKERFIKKFGEEDNLNISELEAKDVKPQEVNKYLFSKGLFANKNLVIISSLFNPYSQKTKRLNELSKALLEPVKKIAKKPAEESNILIFWDRKITQKKLNKRQKKLFKFLKKQEHTTEYKPLSDKKVKNWIKEQTQKHNKKITSGAASLLNEIYESNLHALKNEIEKIIAHNPNQKTIDKKSVQKLVLEKPKQTIWDLTDAVGKKNTKKALILLSRTIKNGTSIDYIIAMLGYQYRLLFKVKNYLKTHKTNSYKKVANALSIHPYPCKKAIKASKKYSLSEIKKIYVQLTNIDLSRKTSSIDSETLLDLLIIKN